MEDDLEAVVLRLPLSFRRFVGGIIWPLPQCRDVEAHLCYAFMTLSEARIIRPASYKVETPHTCFLCLSCLTLSTHESLANGVCHTGTGAQWKPFWKAVGINVPFIAEYD